jgi:phage-related protein
MSTIVVQKVNLYEGIKMPVYTNATRPTSGNSTGDLIFNSTEGKCQLFFNSQWNNLDFEV